MNAEPESKGVIRPDPFFKATTLAAAEAVGMVSVKTEFPQELRADLVLHVPPSLRIVDNMLSFMAAFNSLEFKSENDPFDSLEFSKTVVRTELLVQQNDEATFENTLNVIICSSFPKSFFEYAANKKCRFRAVKGKPWF